MMQTLHHWVPKANADIVLSRGRMRHINAGFGAAQPSRPTREWLAHHIYTPLHPLPDPRVPERTNPGTIRPTLYSCHNKYK